MGHCPTDTCNYDNNTSILNSIPLRDMANGHDMLGYAIAKQLCCQ